MPDTNAVMLRLTLVGAASLVVLFEADNLSPSNPPAFVTSAAARGGGRPATPMSYAGAASRTARPDPNVARSSERRDPNVAGSAERRDPNVAGSVERRDPNVAGAATRDAGVTQSPVIANPYVAGGPATSYVGVAERSVIRNPYVAGAAAAGVATTGVYTDCEQTTDEYGNVSTQC
jgi:hypothetical protein